MKVIFLSNFFNHHQQPFSDAMYTKLGNRYVFIETEAMPQERKALGWGMETLPSYVVTSEMLYRNLAIYKRMVRQADVVIVGSATESLVWERLKTGKLMFRYAERPLKNGFELWKYIPRLILWQWRNPYWRPIYLLCASAYTAEDYRKFFMFLNRAYKWGYFPETKKYDDIDYLIAQKKENSLIWVARYLEWKHPEIAIEIARRLKRDGYIFELKMIGSGQLFEEIIQEVRQEGLENEIRILGAMSPAEVRRHMELAQIHLFTSDRNEGWGVVLNESMNSACVPVADRTIGSVPFLVKNGENGYTYSSIDELYEKVKYLLDHKEERNTVAKKAYATITEEWNAEIAAERLIVLSEALLSGDEQPMKFDKGVCSREAYACKKIGE